ncbi:MAG: Tic22 family protein [Cyanobacteria bacterium P01_H01_bin.121]
MFQNVWPRVMSAASGVLLGSLALIPSAIALTPEQVAEKLARIPVFAMGVAESNDSFKFLKEPLINPDGQPVTNESGQPVTIARVFFNGQAAQAAFESQKDQVPSFPANVEVLRLPLGVVYQFRQQNPDQNLLILPDENQVAEAVNLLQQQGRDVENWVGVPVFFAQYQGPDGELRDTPWMFFDYQQLQQNLPQIRAALSESNPELANTQFQSTVVPLGWLMERITASSDPSMEILQFVLFPPR